MKLIILKLKPIIEKIFKDHPGSTDNFWFATEYDDVIKLFKLFYQRKIQFIW